MIFFQQSLGIDTLRKLQNANPKSVKDSTSTSSKLQLLLGDEPQPTPPPVGKKPRIGPKSKVMKEVKQEKTDTPTKPVNAPAQLVDRKPAIMTV